MAMAMRVAHSARSLEVLEVLEALEVLAALETPEVLEARRMLVGSRPAGSGQLELESGHAPGWSLRRLGLWPGRPS